MPSFDKTGSDKKQNNEHTPELVKRAEDKVYVD